MKKLFAILLLISFTSCNFGANESGGKITSNFYLIGWNERDWQIVHSLDNEIYKPEKIIIKHDVFAVGHNKNFIIVKQHPCEDVEPHLMDFDSPKPNKDITNYYIIKVLKGKPYRLHKFNNKKEFDENRALLGVPKDLTYKFYDKELE